jgi:hypothetical protein
MPRVRPKFHVKLTHLRVSAMMSRLANRGHSSSDSRRRGRGLKKISSLHFLDRVRELRNRVTQGVAAQSCNTQHSSRHLSMLTPARYGLAHYFHYHAPKTPPFVSQHSPDRCDCSPLNFRSRPSSDSGPSRPIYRSRRTRSHRLGAYPSAAQPHQYGHRSRRSHLGR